MRDTELKSTIDATVAVSCKFVALKMKKYEIQNYVVRITPQFRSLRPHTLNSSVNNCSKGLLGTALLIFCLLDKE